MIPLFTGSYYGSRIAKRLKILLPIWIQGRDHKAYKGFTIPLFAGSESGSGITKIWKSDSGSGARIITPLKLKAIESAVGPQTFQLIDLDGSGTLDREELTSWMTMCGAELDVEKIVGALLVDGEDNLTM